MKKHLFLLCAFFLFLEVTAQSTLVKNIEFTNIGPTIMSGRVVDIDVNPSNPSEFYVAYASGGLWYSNNNGISFTSVSNTAPTQNMGDIAIDWEKNILWVGTGESNSSRSSYSGVGLLKSTDNGATWEIVGLTDTHHIGRIILNEKNPNELIVGAIGHLYSPNKQRGIFKTTDGGKTWKNTLFINENTGVIDISISPTNSNIMFAASWERDRKAWHFKGNGENTAIYKSTDGGTTWKKITTTNSGFPIGEGIGRIGLAAFNDSVVYALVDNQNRRPKKAKKTDELQKDDFKKMSLDAFYKLPEKKLKTYLEQNGFDEKYTVKEVKSLVKKGEIKPIDLATYLEDANSLLFDTPVIGAEVYKTIDGGKTWEKTHDQFLDDVYSSYGYYFGTIAVNHSNQNKLYIGGVPLLKSNDGGATFKLMSKENVHGDHQVIWVNSKVDGHVINGNDGGVNITYDDGENWMKCNNQAVGQFYSVNVDNKKPYNVFGGLQDNGVWYGPNTYKASKRWNSTGNYPYKMIGGGDGMQVQIDKRNNNIVYSGSQFGYYYRVDLSTKKYKNIHPKHKLGESPYRYNWQTPILLSPHNQDILYMGANKLLRSMDKGEHFDVISKDLTTGGKKGNVPYGTLTTISESPFQFGLIYVGSDDGYVNLTKDGGASWTRISDNLPQNLWVSRVIASQHHKNRVYVSLNGYRDDDFKPYVFKSEDFGSTWQLITKNLPNSPVNVIREDPSDERMLYVGTDDGVYVSFDNGNYWHAFSKGLVKVAVHDLVIQEEAKDLVIGTHGRSIYKANIAPLQSYNKFKNKKLALFKLKDIRFSSRWGSAWSTWLEPSEPNIEIAYFTSEAGKYTVEISAKDNTTLANFEVDASRGFNFFDYNLTINKKVVKNYFTKKGITVKQASNKQYYLPKGTYKVTLKNKKNKETKEFSIK